MNDIVIAIDGYSGCGKSSTARAVASSLHYTYIDTGAMYRAVTLYFIQHNVDLENATAVAQALKEIHLHFEIKPDTNKNEIFLNGENVEKEIRTMEVSELVSPVSALVEVRKAMVAEQRNMGEKKKVVMDGRDIGTNVFPAAELKIFMTADLKVRAERRKIELEDKGQTATLDEVIGNLEKRDLIDTSRKENPLVKAEDAVEIDTTNLSFAAQTQQVITLAEELIGKQEVSEK